MELRHLKLINEVSKSGSLTKASENLYLSQSALSHQLKEIEIFFKAQLFIRQNRQMVLTKEGRIVLLASQRILDEIGKRIAGGIRIYFYIDLGIKGVIFL